MLCFCCWRRLLIVGVCSVGGGGDEKMKTNCADNEMKAELLPRELYFGLLSSAAAAAASYMNIRKANAIYFMLSPSGQVQ